MPLMVHCAFVLQLGCKVFTMIEPTDMTWSSTITTPAANMARPCRRNSAPPSWRS